MEEKVLSKEEIELLKKYSEGNQYLFDALCECWKHNIRTYACCGGHKKEDDDPYLGIIIDDNSLGYIKRIISRLQYTEDIVLQFTERSHDGKDLFPDMDVRAFLIRGYKHNRCELFYKALLAIKSEKCVELSENIKNHHSAKSFYTSLEDFYKMNYSEIKENIDNDVIISSCLSNVSNELIEYKFKGSRILRKLMKLPIFRKILEKIFPNIKNQNEKYAFLNSKYGFLQEEYQPSLEERLEYEDLETKETPKSESTKPVEHEKKSVIIPQQAFDSSEQINSDLGRSR